jgi:Rha family phage regulatory protein
MKSIAPVTTPVLVELTDGQPTTTSLDVAAHFRKQHKTVLRAIANLECSPEFNRHNFAPVGYTDAAGRKYTQYRMTRDGFTFLCMSFTGKEAAQWKEAYILAFNQIESELTHKAQATPQPSLLNRRWLVFFDHNGKEHVKPIPDDAGS